MKTRKAIFISLAMVTSMAQAESGSSVSVQWPAASELVAVNRMVLGVNVNFESRPYRLTNTEVMRLSKELAPTVLRYPGGTLANFFIWEAPRLVTEKEMGAFTLDRQRKAMKHTQSNLDAFKEGKPDSTADVNAFAKKIGADHISYVLNLWTGTPEMSAKWVKYNLDHGFDNLYYELGNEYYLKNCKIKYPEVQDYIAEAEKHTAAIRLVCKNVKIAVVGTPFRDVADAMYDKGYSGDWVSEVGEATWNQKLALQKFYDGVIVHDYFVPPNEIAGMSADEAHRCLMARLPRDFDNQIAYYKAIFGEDVKLWFTEWNFHPVPFQEFLKKKDEGEAAKYWTTKTMDQGLYLSEMLLRMLAHGKEIVFANCHVLAAPFFWGLFQGEMPEEKNLNSPFVKNIGFDVFQLLIRAARDSQQLAFLNLRDLAQMEGTGKYKGVRYPGAMAMAFYKNGKVNRIFALNKAAEPLKLEGLPKVLSAEWVFARTPLENWGASKPVENETMWKPAFNRTKGTDPTIPGYGFGLLTFEQ